MLLATWDTDKVKEYVFATSRLREIRGASALLDELNDDDVARIVGSVVGVEGKIYAGGGTALALLDSEAQFDQITQEIERKYRDETRTAEITAACIEVFEEDLDKRFGELARVLNHKLRAVKEGKVSSRVCISSPIL
ncbi:MAG: hypothetical protein WAV47_23520, partial [Blastocatellia bacterium]